MDESIPTEEVKTEIPAEAPLSPISAVPHEYVAPWPAPEDTPAAEVASLPEPQQPDDDHPEVDPPSAVNPEIGTPAADQTAPPDAAPQIVQPLPPALDKPRASYSRGQVIAFGLALSLVTLVLAVVFSLGFLALINRGLSFPSTARFNDLSRQAGTIQRQADTLQQDVSGLQTRLNALETIGGRVAAVEKDTQTLKTDLADSAKKVGQLQGQVSGLSLDVDSLKTRTQFFDSFLQNLRDFFSKNQP